MCPGTEEHIWASQPVCLQDLVCCIHFEERGRAAQPRRRLQNRLLSSGLAPCRRSQPCRQRRQSVISTLQIPSAMSP